MGGPRDFTECSNVGTSLNDVNTILGCNITLSHALICFFFLFSTWLNIINHFNERWLTVYLLNVMSSISTDNNIDQKKCTFPISFSYLSKKNRHTCDSDLDVRK